MVIGRSGKGRQRRMDNTQAVLAAAETVEREEPGASWARRLGGIFRTSLWPFFALFTLLAAIAVFSNSPGRYVIDNRFEYYWSPLHVLKTQFYLWDASRGLGAARPEYLPTLNAFLVAVRYLGASPAVAERLLHLAMLVTGGVGIVALLRRFLPALGLAHLIAGLFYMFSPYTASFIVPSELFLAYALAPWLLLLFIRGVEGKRRWGWAARFAIVVFVAGWTNPPGLAWAMLPILPMGLYLLFVERTIRVRDIVAWAWRALILCLLVSIAGIAKTFFGAASLVRNLNSTETPSGIALGSSWSESWRGLGFWLSYWIDARGVTRPQNGAFFESLPMVLATFVAPCTALAVVWLSRWRARIAFAGAALVSVTFMVGVFPSGRPSPLGRLLLTSFDRVQPLYALRNTYKAGAGLAIGVAALFAVAVVAASGKLAERSSRTTASLPFAAAVILIAIVSYPFWTGNLYPPADQMSSVPSYYRSAISWLDSRPGRSRVLVVPGTAQTRYRWGSPGDDVFDALLARPHIIRGVLPQGTPEAANLISALDDSISAGKYRPGIIGPIARRLGIEYVVIRNDLDWQALDRARPSHLQVLRNDSDMQLVNTFGVPGQNVVRQHDKSADVIYEQGLPPIQIYRVKGAGDPVRTVTGAPPLLVSGDGNAWPVLAQTGALDGANPVRYTGDLSAHDAATAVASGAPVVITDSNRRRIAEVAGFGERFSETLAAGQSLGRGDRDPFHVAGAESVATFGDATLVYDPDADKVFSSGVAHRAAAAFDNNPDSSWLTGSLIADVHSRLIVRLRHSHVVSSVTIVPAQLLGVKRRIVEVSLHFSDGSSVPVSLVKGATTVHFRPRRTHRIELRIDKVFGSSFFQPVGLSEVTFPGLDLRERIQLPDDLIRATAHDHTLRTELENAAVTYQFDRALGRGSDDDEIAVLRRFRTVGKRSFALNGVMQLGKSTPDRFVSTIANLPTSAYGSDRYGDLLANAGLYAIDGRLDTGWAAPGQAGEKLVVDFPPQVVTSITVAPHNAAEFSTVDTIRLTVGNYSKTASLRPAAACEPFLAGFVCRNSGRITIPPTSAHQASIEITRVKSANGPFGTALPIRIDEIAINDKANSLPLQAKLTACIGIPAVDGQSVPVRIDGTLDDLLAGNRLPFSSCEPVALATGWHTFDSGPTLLTRAAFRVDATKGTASRGRAVKTEVLSQSPTHIKLRVIGAPGQAAVISGQSFDANWRASAGGRALHRVNLDTQSAFSLPGDGTIIVDISFPAQRTYELTLLVTALGVLLCAALAFRRLRRR
jgi:arabinofuranan 3-O-arabinosyltransferase